MNARTGMRIGLGIVAVCMVSLSGMGRGGVQETGTGREGLVKLLPEETAFYMSLKNAPEAVRKWKESPFRKMLDHEAYRSVMEEFEERWDESTKQFREDTGLDLQEFLGLFDGEVALAIPGLASVLQILEKKVENGESLERYRWSEHFKKHGMPDVVLAAEARTKTGDVKKFMDALFAKAAEQKRITVASKTVEGIEATVVKRGGDPEWYYAQVGSWCMFVSTESMLATLIRNSGSSHTSLADHPDFKRFCARVGSDSDFLFYLDARPLVKIVRTVIAASLQKKPEAKPYEEIIYRALDALLGFGDLTGVGFGARLDAESASVSAYAGTKGDLQGILRLLAGKKERIELGPFLPREITSVSITHLDIQTFWKGLDEVIAMAVKKYQEQTKQKMDPRKIVEQMIGFKIGDVVNMLDSEVVTYTLPGRALDLSSSQRLLLWRVKDKTKVQELLDKLMDNPFLGMMSTVRITPKDVEGFKVYYVHTPFHDGGVGVVDSWLAVGSGQEILNDFIRRQKKSGLGSIRDRADYSVLQSRLAIEASSVSYLSASEVLQNLYSKSRHLDPKKMPSAEFYDKFFSGMFGSIVPEKDGVLFRWELQYRR